MIKTLYFCAECKKALNENSDILYVQERNPKGFCSEDCIEKHYEILRRELITQELELRHIMGLSTDEGIAQEDKDNAETIALFGPKEVWKVINALDEEYCIHIAKLDDGAVYYAVFIISYVASNPSYIYHKLFTRNEALVNEYRSGAQIKQNESKEDTKTVSQKTEEYTEDDVSYSLNQEILDEMESKRSHYLAQLIGKRTDEDIEFERFPHFDQYLKSSLDDPDEVYEYQDHTSDNMATYIKSYNRDNETFFYVVICWKCFLDHDQQEVVLPIISFPSRDADLYRFFADGKRVGGQIKS